MSFFNSSMNIQSDIYELTHNLENVKRAGDKFRATCPICGSKSSRPFILFPNGGYYCHSCNEKGSIFSLIRDVFRLNISDFRDTIQNLNPSLEMSKTETDSEIEKKRKKFLYLHNLFYERTLYHPKEVYKLLYELIPKETEYLNLSKNYKYIGYDERNDTLTVSLIDEDDNIVNIKRRKVGDIKWMGLKGGDGKFAPHRLTGKKFVYIASGIAEFLILNATELDYIVMQSDGANINHLIPEGVTAVVLEDNDKRDIKNEEDKKYQCFKNPNKFNPFKKKVTDKITTDKISIDFERVLYRELKAGYDLRDFVTENPSNWLNLIEKELKYQLSRPKDEIVITYDGRFPDFSRVKDIETGVIVSKPHSGKTYAFEGIAGNLIIVPRVNQSDVFKGDCTDYLINKIFEEGAIITFHKFYGHYKYNEEFRSFIDSKKIKLIVDEAHELLFNPSKEFQLIYNLDAIFLSGTLEKFFRPDLQRYKYKPKKPDIIYYTKNGELPNHYRSIVFIDNAKALKANYPYNSVVGKEHRDFRSVNIHKTDKKIVFTTSALREGVSVKNFNFNACMVYNKECRLWNMKQKIQALYRLRRDDAIRIISAPPKPEYRKYIDYKWWENFIKTHTDEQIINTIMGEHYSEMMKITHKVNGYKKADKYSIVCYLSRLTRNNYDKDFFMFMKYREKFEPLKIDTKVEKSKISDESEESFNYIFDNEEEWSIPKSKRRAFDTWLEHYRSGFIYRLEKFKKFKNLGKIYKTSNVAKSVKAQYNRTHKKRYTIEDFYKLLRALVKIEMIDDKTGKIIERVGKKTDLRDVSIRVVGNCAINGIKKIEEKVKKELKNIINKTKKWLDSFRRVKRDIEAHNIGVSIGLQLEIKDGNYYNILRA